MKISLMVLSAGKAAGRTLPVNVAQFIIGRDPECNLRPASAMISKRHCAVIVKDGRIFLRDFESTNGTFVNDQPIKGEVSIKDGDLLKVGPLSFKVVIEGQPAPVKETPKPVPAPALADISDDDAAAALLCLDEGDPGNVGVSTSETAEDSIPDGTTVMDMPAFAPKEGESAAKPEEKKPAAKKAPPAADARDSARAILEKLRTGKRK